MSFVVRKLRQAEEDAVEAAIWYEERQAGLGEEFIDELDLAVRALSQSALRNRIRFAAVRRAAIARFKFYGIYYTMRENEVWILAIFHGRRHPRVLQERAERGEAT
jgi:plasmid stabilization system protein ParE